MGSPSPLFSGFAVLLRLFAFWIRNEQMGLKKGEGGL